MDTDDKYRDAEIVVVEAGSKGPDWYVDALLNKTGVTKVHPLPDHHPLDEDVPVDGQVEFIDREKMENDEGGWRYYSFPFRSVDKDGPWEVYPDKEWGKQHPVWKWTNPQGDPHDNLTLEPSLGVGDPMHFHCYVRQGEIQWL